MEKANEDENALAKTTKTTKTWGWILLLAGLASVVFGVHTYIKASSALERGSRAGKAAYRRVDHTSTIGEGFRAIAEGQRRYSAALEESNRLGVIAQTALGFSVVLIPGGILLLGLSRSQRRKANE